MTARQQDPAVPAVSGTGSPVELPGGRPAPLPAALRAGDRTLVMGVVNVTPDSFSDGGRWFTPGAAVAHGLTLLEQGADLLDVGGESTRPGSRRVPVEDELVRVLPVVEELVRRGATVSVDTTRAAVARAAVERGAAVVNDVSGGLADEEMAGVVATTGAVYVAMHWRGHADVMDQLDRYGDVVADVRRELAARVAALRAAGVRDEQIVLDPGLGFAKPGASNWPLLARLPELVADGFPVLVGASRKRFLGHLLADADGHLAPPLARDGATAAVSALAAASGAWCVRVHDVPGSVDAVRVAAAWRAARPSRPARMDTMDELPVDEDAADGRRSL
ncbi:dihydropteroate synthase [Cellulomonas soli]|uniref:dihydropteroate synthase n=1 Tax=Cellulomonas soli TaxID=931535 RepID=UPI003F832661